MIASADELVARARAATGLSDFGADGWQVGLTQFVDAVRADLAPSAATCDTFEAMIVGRLVNRLRIEGWYRDRAGAAIAPVEGPVVIVGLPRTGTTALQYLLSLDPQFRYLRAWESGEPVPPPVATNESADPRRLRMVPRSNDVRHISAPDGPIEDIGPLGLDFHNQELGLPLPSFTAWWRGADLTSTFLYHERVLQLLHSQRPPYRWLLKAPAYLFQLARITKQYPNARFLMTHRDPALAIPSTCSTVVNAQRNAFPAHVRDSFEIGHEMVEHFVEGTVRAIGDRDQLGQASFLDVAQSEIERDPLRAVERIYDFLGLRLTREVRDTMSQWTTANQRGARGEHRYTPDQFGLSVERIRRAFAEYIERFGAVAGVGLSAG